MTSSSEFILRSAKCFGFFCQTRTRYEELTSDVERKIISGKSGTPVSPLGELELSISVEMNLIENRIHLVWLISAASDSSVHHMRSPHVSCGAAYVV